MFLMNKNRPVLWYQMSDDETAIKILNNNLLPYSLKDYLHDTGTQSLNRSISEISTLRDWLAGRTLSLSRDNAKAILNSAALPQSIRTDEKIRIVEACRGLSVTDSYWLKQDDENIVYDSVNLRHQHLKDAAFAVSIKGDTLSIQKEILAPDIGTKGMFRKTWYRSDDGIELWKTDRTPDFINTKCEVEASNILGTLGVNHVPYQLIQKDGILIATCPCITDDHTSLIAAQEIRDYCNHTKTDFNKFITPYETAFANMAVCDYLIANTDRHIENWGFLVDTETNNITGPAPLYDHNQALISDYAGKDVADLIYDPTGKAILESAIMYFSKANIDTTNLNTLPEQVRMRYEQVKTAYENRKNKRMQQIHDALPETENESPENQPDIKY